jgi:hypothetical protein
LTPIEFETITDAGQLMTYLPGMAIFRRTPQPKKFSIAAAEVERLIQHDLPCFATDKITVDGLPVGWFYKDFDEESSGWTFMSGTETDEYANDPNNTSIYSLNTIANYDHDIIPFLSAPRGSAYERKTPGAAFTPIADWVAPTD